MQDRILIRVSTEFKQRLETAATYKRLNVSSYVRMRLEECVKEDLKAKKREEREEDEPELRIAA